MGGGTDDAGRMWPAQGRSLAFLGGLALALGGLLYAYLLWSSNTPCRGEMCGLGRLPMAVMLGGLALLAGGLAGLLAFVAALEWHDRLAAAGQAFVALLGCLAAYALWNNGHPGHPVVTAIYGFPPADLGSVRHPLAFPLSIALLAMLPVAAVFYGLAPVRLRRAAVLVSVLLSLGLLLAIRVAA